MLVGVAGGQEGQEDLVAPAEIGRDDVGRAGDIVEDRAVMLHHPARRAAGAAGVDEAGEVVAADLGHRAASAPRRPPPPPTRLRPVMRHGRRRLPGRCAMSSMAISCWQSGASMHRRQQGPAPACWVETITARAPALSEDMAVIALGVGGVGRHGDAARGHDREVGDQPFGPVLADQHRPGRRASARSASAPRPAPRPAAPPRAS